MQNYITKIILKSILLLLFLRCFLTCEYISKSFVFSMNVNISTIRIYIIAIIKSINLL